MTHIADGFQTRLRHDPGTRVRLGAVYAGRHQNTSDLLDQDLLFSSLSDFVQTAKRYKRQTHCPQQGPVEVPRIKVAQTNTHIKQYVFSKSW